MGRAPDEKLIEEALPVIRYHLGVVETRLKEAAFLAGAEYSLADSFMYPVIEATCAAPEGAAMVADLPVLTAWLNALRHRRAILETAWPDLDALC
jgi:glutathione S-transferase